MRALVTEGDCSQLKDLNQQVCTVAGAPTSGNDLLRGLYDSYVSAKYVESNDHAIRRKAEIMIDHFHDQVIGLQKIGGKARAMVVTSGIARAIQYKRAFDEYLAERKSPYRAIIAFSGEHEYGGEKLTEASMNKFVSNLIPEQFQEDPYRFLIVADKFQTGYDEPLLHTMYVDKVLAGVKAVQTLSRLNRTHPQKHDTLVLDLPSSTVHSVLPVQRWLSAWTKHARTGWPSHGQGHQARAEQ